MSEVVTTEETPAAPAWELGQVNTQSLQELLIMLGNNYPFQDETSKIAFNEQVLTLGDAGDPHADSSGAGEAEVSDLEARLAQAQAEINQLKNAQATAAATGAATPAEGTTTEVTPAGDATPVTPTPENPAPTPPAAS